MNTIDVLREIERRAKEGVSVGLLRDYYAMVREALKDENNRKLAITYGKKLSDRLEAIIPATKDLDLMKEYYCLHEQTLLTLAPFDFDAYCLYIEWDRNPKSKFYAPRRKQLRPLAEALQDLYYGDLECLCISMPPGTGKSGLALFFLTWWGGHIPNRAILTVSHNHVFVKGAYEEIKKIIGKDSEYRFSDVFPEVKIENTDALGLTIALDRSARFPTYQFGSLGSGLAGRVRAESLLFCDDLIPTIEVALSEEQLQKVWLAYTSDLLQRMIGDCKQLMIMTRWSLRDPIGRLKLQYEDDPKYKFIEVDAMDENGESNFDYPYHLGYSTLKLKALQRDMDETVFNALYMNRPVEREGQLYPSDELRRYFELPDREPDARIAICDTKDKGEDYEFMPIAYKYGNDYYIADCVCNDGKPEVLEIMLTNLLIQHNVQLARFESNSAGGKTAENVQKMVKDRGGITKITTKYTTANKETKIFVNAPYVKEHFLFLDDSKVENREYRRMLQFLTSYSMKGKNKHDDVPDGMAMLALFAQDFVFKNTEVFTRPF